MGEHEVPADHYWGAQTQRIAWCTSRSATTACRRRVYHAYGYVKKAAALVNAAAGRLAGVEGRRHRARSPTRSSPASSTSEFPLYVWQTGSGTQSNMNVNEVISNRAIQLLGGKLGSKTPVHPNDDVNMAQSSNDTFPTAMHIAAVLELDQHLLPSVEKLTRAIEAKADAWKDVVKIGRTHLEDAVPLTVGDEWSGWAAQLRDATENVRRSMDGSLSPRRRGTAVGTGLNAPPGFAAQIAREDRRADEAALRDGAEQVRRAGIARRDGGGDGGAARARGEP